MIKITYSIFIRYVERISTIKDLVRRLNEDLAFKMNCGFKLSDAVPSEAAYSRLLAKLCNTDVLEKAMEHVIHQAISGGFIEDDTVSIDATHFEARDQAPPKKEAKEETGADGKIQNSVSIYAKKIEDQKDVSHGRLRSEIPLEPQWGITKNSEGKNVFCYGYKAHLDVGTSSQYIFRCLMSSGNLNDGKAAIPLLKGLENLHLPGIRYYVMDAGYDYRAICEQIHRMGSQSVIAYNKRNEKELDGFDSHFAPTCLREHSYRYDSYDSKYKTIKYVTPKECGNCPLAHEGMCQKVLKIKITADLRRYTAPARGSIAWKKIFKRRTAVERVNAYLKEFFQLNNVRYRGGRGAKVHLNSAALVYNASKLAADRLNNMLYQQQAS